MCKRFLAPAAILCAVFLIVSSFLPQPEAADPIRFSMDWVIGGTHAAFFSALDRGNYAKEGIQATLDRGELRP